MKAGSDGLVRSLVGLCCASVGLFLAAQALLFLVHGKASFARSGLPDSVRVALAGAEIVTGVLFAIPRPVLRRLAGMGLVAVLAWAAGCHFALRLSAGPLYVFAAVVLLLAAIPLPDTARY